MRRIREGLGQRQKYAAAEIGISASCLNRLEHGHSVLPYRIAVRAARLYNSDPGALDDGLGGPLRPIVPPLIR